MSQFVQSQSAPRPSAFRRLVAFAKRHWKTEALMLGAFVIGWGVFATWVSAIEHTNHTEFCISCHVMEATVYQEYRQSSHYHNKLGVHVGCPDCHVPQYDWVAEAATKVGTVKELYSFFTAYYFRGMGDIERFEKTRPELAKEVWAKFYANNARECRHCHDYNNMILADQKPSARSMHSDAMKTDQNCIDCHKGITHKNYATPVAAPAPTDFDVK